MKPRALSLRPIAISLTVGLLLAACGSGAEEATPTFTVAQIQTEAVATFAAGLTETALAMPTNTPTETMTPTTTATNAPVATNTVAATAVSTIPVGSCEGLAYVSDVTVPDNTTMTPSQQFIKTWRVRNTGTCPWETSFELNFTGGEAMGGSSIGLASVVEPGNDVDLSVDLTAPTTAGTYRANWLMTNAGGTFFGDEIYVQIVVSGAAATSTPSASSTPTLTPTATPTETATP